MIKACIFDLDGTLVNSLYDLADSTNYALKQFGFPIHETEKYKYFVGDGMPKLIERTLPENARTEETKKAVLDCFMAYYREHYLDKTAVYDGITDVVNQLINNGVKVAVMSNKADEMAKIVTNKLFGDIFSAVYGKRVGYPAKPDPTLTLELMSELGVSPCECAFIGDSGMDMAVAKNAGAFAIGVLWGFRKEEELLSNGADFIAKTPDDIIKIIEEL